MILEESIFLGKKIHSRIENAGVVLKYSSMVETVASL
jgi:hypothetical protein